MNLVVRESGPPLSGEDARALTNVVKKDAVALWGKLRRLYDGQAHTALGYASWGEYFETEFGQSGRYGYRLLKANEVMEQLPAGNRPTTEAVARELVPLMGAGHDVAKAWATIVERHGPGPTAAQVRREVRGMTGGAKSSPSAHPESQDDAPAAVAPMPPEQLEQDGVKQDGDAELVERAEAERERLERKGLAPGSTPEDDRAEDGGEVVKLAGLFDSMARRLEKIELPRDPAIREGVSARFEFAHGALGHAIEQLRGDGASA